MNIVEVARTMKEGQIAESKELNTRVKLVDEYHLYYVYPDNALISLFEFNADEWLADDWEVEVQWVDFWTAYQALKSGKKIKCEYWDSNVFSLIDDMRFSSRLIDGKWQIID